MLDKMLTGKAVAVTPFIGEIEQGMGGGSTPQDLETMFQLLYLRFTQPRADPTAFAAMASQAQGAAAPTDGEPGRRVQPDDRRRAQPEPVRGGSPRRRRRWTSGTSPSRWRSTRRASRTPSNFTFVFVGSFTPEMIKPFVETYVASLPATHAHETWRDLGITPPTGVDREDDREGDRAEEPGGDRLLGAVRVRRRAPAGAADDDAAAAVAAARHASGRSSAAPTASPPTPDADEDSASREYSVRIEWTCDPARTATLVQRVFEEIEYVKGTVHLARADGADPRRAACASTSRTARRTATSSTRSRAATRTATRRTWRRSASCRTRSAALTGEAIQQAAQTYLNTANYVKVTLMPAK